MYSELPDLANENTEHLVKFQFHISNKYSYKYVPEILYVYLYTKLFAVFLKFRNLEKNTKNFCFLFKFFYILSGNPRWMVIVKNSLTYKQFLLFTLVHS